MSDRANRPRLSLSEAAELLELPRVDVLALVADGQLPAQRDGHRVLFDPDDVERYRATQGAR